ncbi:MAG: DUF6691 family protein [Solimonas sp.]
MKNLLIRLLPLLSGFVFGVGLVISGMANPQKVLGFLDFAGAWDPQLIFVMGGAVLVALPAFALARRRPRAWSGEAIVLPQRSPITPRLVAGSALFGLGWGLSGVCPGPALLIAVGGTPSAFVFFISMLGGMLAFELWNRLRGATVTTAAPSSPSA